ncbi:MAG: aminomethyl-transferring glycine dehydrogenase [Planctomycetes bacterium]|jgi:glycine dehydrogenase subunit 1|nr:aminomethyl-transferring glycine dehydrogenase [Planctomycetota bacterium]HJO27174.1 aminomethyl-transferring glycine dehydrogenase subunit GcvPA [Planctomycetota bacterium]
MPYIQNTDADRAAMLESIGVRDLEELFEQIPQELRLARPLDLPSGLSELELKNLLAERASWNSTGEHGCFLGGGVYRHFTPSVVDALQGRQEFVTAYTPYQPEASQGTLTAFFEFQTMIAELTGMEVANASMYDGASAAVEAVFLAAAVRRGRRRVVVSAALHPHTLRTLRTCLAWTKLELVVAPIDENGRTDLDGLLDKETCAVLIQNPNFLGVIEDLEAVAADAARADALPMASVYPTSLGLLRAPGEVGFAVVVGDGQGLGLPPALGGPSFGIFAVRQEFVRKMPGRIVGETVDREGRRGFVLTFQTREQHIRREKATSNICTNNALAALRGAIYLAAAGPQGLAEVARHCHAKASYAAQAISALPNFSLPHGTDSFFNEFLVRCPIPAAQVNRALDGVGLIGGLEVARVVPAPDELGLDDHHLLLAFTETTTRSSIDRLLALLAGLASSPTAQPPARRAPDKAGDPHQADTPGTTTPQEA